MDVKQPQINAVEATISDQKAITLAAPEQCPRYLGRVIKGIDVSRPTPIWMSEKLRRSGIRSIDPVVDVTNYVLLELGHPMHACDLDTLQGDITVRLAAKQEKLTLLDGEEVTLDDDVLVIADEQKALAMAGVYGGKDSGVTLDSKNIFLESAFFAPDAILGKARRYGLHTDASHRYERGFDPQLQRTAMERATELLLAICGGEAGPITEAVSEPHLPARASVTLRSSRLAKVLGVQIADNEATIPSVWGLKSALRTAHGRFRCRRIVLTLPLKKILSKKWHGYGYNAIRRISGCTVAHDRPQKAQISRHTLVNALVERGYQEAVPTALLIRSIKPCCLTRPPR